MIRKRLFYDIETSYYIVKAWRPGYGLNINPQDVIKFPKVICACYKWEGEDKVHRLVWDENQEDAHIIEKLIEVFDKANQIVAHNGDSFDLKWVRMRAIDLGIEMAPRYQTVDTKKLAKSHFNFHSNKLDELGRFFKLGRKKHTEMELWDRVILDKEPEALEYMVEYCAQDVVLLEQIFEKMRPYVRHNFNYAKLYEDKNWACPECGDKYPYVNKCYTTAMGVRRYEMKCRHKKECGTRFVISYLTYRNYSEWKLRNPRKV